MNAGSFRFVRRPALTVLFYFAAVVLIVGVVTILAAIDRLISVLTRSPL